RIEWCRARARAHRWQEECLLLAEEMTRVQAYFSYQAGRWEQLSKDPPLINVVSIDDEQVDREDLQSIINGKRAYTLRQADIQRTMLKFCQSKWIGLSEKLLTMEGRDARVMVERQ
ncbi:hypothetical protein BDN70DRAFT_814948, partial [Pholiota conissans]